VLLGVGGLFALGYSVFFSGDDLRLGYLGAAVVSLVVLGMGWGRVFPTYYAPIPINHDDPVMKESVATARREFARFSKGVREGRKQPFIRFPLKAPSGEVEHIWALVHSLADAVVQASLANDPVHSQENRDPRFAVAIEDIEDWILVDGNGVTEGGYTHLAMARLYKKEKGFVPRAMQKQLAAFKDLELGELHDGA
jgi:uncharacterized protein YegJ (DUF2314 family)